MWLMFWNEKGFDEIRFFGAMEGDLLYYVMPTEVISTL